MAIILYYSLKPTNIIIILVCQNLQNSTNLQVCLDNRQFGGLISIATENCLFILKVNDRINIT